MNKFNSGLKFNKLGTVKYNTQILQAIRQYFTRIGVRPIILDQNQNALAVLENSFDIELEQEVNGIDEITFSLPFTDVKKEFLKNENLVQMFETLYIIREVKMKKGSSNPSIEVHAEALWYDLQFSDPLSVTEWQDASAYQVLSDILRGTGWSVGVVENNSRRTLKLSEETDNPLKAISSARSLYSGDLKFNTVTRKVDLLRENVLHSGASIVYRKNMQEIEASYETRNLVTRLYVYGKGGLTIEAANNGSKYIENYSYTSKKRVRSIKDERFTNPFHLKDWAEEQLKMLSQPRASYQITAQDLSTLSGLTHEKFVIGYMVRVYDKELKLDINTRIMKWTYNVAEPWRTKIELETTVKSLSDLLAGDISGSDSFTSEDAVEKQEMLELMVFNYLLNSRADDGFSYWANAGWTIDAVNGYSGPASFKAVGELGKTKELKQSVYPSHRESYSISFRAHAENLVKGPDGRVGINVKITYEDGTTGTQFIPLA
ncbi:phage tail protein [Bacillus sp. FSL R10-2789]|uniref:phage tail protein n=1 Tax=Bacillus sp. FSL R10-2789 TaxID=2954662 RepID=UPI0030FC4857